MENVAIRQCIVEISVLDEGFNVDMLSMMFSREPNYVFLVSIGDNAQVLR